MDSDRLNRKVGYGMLAAFYAPMLTSRQQTMISLYCDEDYSLSEIAGQMSVSRQAVSDNLNRAYERLEALESRLKLYSSFLQLDERMKACRNLLSQVKASQETEDYLSRAIRMLDESAQGGAEDGV